ncbi:MAG: cysteine desulfurase family protein [Candidatus Cryosericum sp.]|nr:cysteine desulfurase [bacterium]
MIYLDNFRSTMVAPEVWEAMRTVAIEKYAVPAAFTQCGTEAAELIEGAQSRLAAAIGASQSEIVFTGSGTDAINVGLLGATRAAVIDKPEIVTSEIEHPATLAVYKELEKEGYKAHYVKVNSEGCYDLDELASTLNEHTAMVSLMGVNHMIGTIEPISRAGDLIAEASKRVGHKILYHVDFASALQTQRLDVNAVKADLVSFSSNKIHGPKGVGALYVRKGTKVMPITFGAESYSPLVPGTPNTMGIAGFDKAVELLYATFDKDVERMRSLVNRLESGIKERIPYILINGPEGEERAASHLCCSFLYIEGEAIMMFLNMDGIVVDTGSACAAATLKPNYILMAIGRNHEEAHGSIRFTLSRYNTEADVDTTLTKLIPIVERLRAQSTIKPPVQ